MIVQKNRRAADRNRTGDHVVTNHALCLAELQRQSMEELEELNPVFQVINLGVLTLHYDSSGPAGIRTQSHRLAKAPLFR